MSIHTILSQEIVSDKTNRLYVRSKKYPNGGLIMGIEVDKFLKHFATRIVEEVGKCIPDEKYHEYAHMECPKCKSYGNSDSKYCQYDRSKLIVVTSRYTNEDDENYNLALSDICTKLQKMKEI